MKNRWKVEIVEDYETRLIFIGNNEESTRIYDTLTRHHKYDYDTSVQLSEIENTAPEFNSVKEFYSVYEYRHA